MIHERIAYFILLTVAFALPVAVYPWPAPVGRLIIAYQELPLYVLCCILAACLLFDAYRGRGRRGGVSLHVTSVLFGAYVFITALSAFGCRLRAFAVEDVARVSSFLVLLCAVGRFVEGEGERKALLAAWCLSMVPVWTKELILHPEDFRLMPAALWGDARLGNSMGNVNIFGGYAAGVLTASLLLLVGALRRRERGMTVLTGVSGVLSALAVVASGSRGALLGLLAGGAVALVAVPLYMGFKRKYVAVACTFVVLSAAALAWNARGAVRDSLREGTLGVRAYIYEAALSMMRDHPALGVGAGGFELSYAVYRNPLVFANPFGKAPVAAHAHDHLLEAGAESGIPALLLLACFYGLAIGRGLGGAGGWYALTAAAAASCLLAHGMVSVLLDARVVPFAQLGLLCGVAASAVRRLRDAGWVVAFFAALFVACVTGVVLQVFRNNATAWNMVASEKMNSFAYGDAATGFERSLWWRFDPKIARKYAYSLAQACRYEEAAAAYLRILDVAPDYGFVPRSLADVFRRKGEPEKAYRWLRRWLRLNPFDPGAAADEVFLLLDMNRLAEAESRSREYAASFPGDTAVLTARAAALLVRGGDVGEAVRLAEAAVRNGFFSPRSVAVYVLALHASGDRERANNLFDEHIRRLDPFDAFVRRVAKVVEPVLSDPSKTGILFLRAAESLRGGDPERAAVLMTKLLMAAPDDPVILNNLSVCFWHMARAEKDPNRRRRYLSYAAFLLRRALRAVPRQKDLLLALCDVLKALGDRHGVAECRERLRLAGRRGISKGGEK